MCVHQRIDMVPELLSSNLCSLRSNVERWGDKHSNNIKHHQCSFFSQTNSVNKQMTVLLFKRLSLIHFLFSLTRLAFSCIWEMNHKAEIVKTRFTKSVINSKVQYQHAMDDDWKYTQCFCSWCVNQMHCDTTTITISNTTTTCVLFLKTHYRV